MMTQGRRDGGQFDVAVDAELCLAVRSAFGSHSGV
jgi:hypothetical protein